MKTATNNLLPMMALLTLRMDSLLNTDAKAHESEQYEYFYGEDGNFYVATYSPNENASWRKADEEEIKYLDEVKIPEVINAMINPDDDEGIKIDWDKSLKEILDTANHEGNLDFTNPDWVDSKSIDIRKEVFRSLISKRNQLLSEYNLKNPDAEISQPVELFLEMIVELGMGLLDKPKIQEGLLKKIVNSNL
jgi:hypothetical protein